MFSLDVHIQSFLSSSSSHTTFNEHSDRQKTWTIYNNITIV